MLHNSALTARTKGMIHAPAEFLNTLYQSWTERMAANPAMTISDLRGLFEEWHKPTLEPEGVTYRHEVLGGVDAIWATPLDADRSKVILYAHGGGFAVGSAASHRKLAGHLAKELSVTALAVDYRRAPEHPFPPPHPCTAMSQTPRHARGATARSRAEGDRDYPSDARGRIKLQRIRSWPSSRATDLVRPATPSLAAA
jgi:hypothetical protein